jgi:hypothetical protein
MTSNTTLIHGSTTTSGYIQIEQYINSNISWGFTLFPYVGVGSGLAKDNATHFGCISNNVTLLNVCCDSLNGSYVSTDGNESSGNVTEPLDMSQWCMLPDTNVYTDYYNVQPALATSFAECYKRTVVPANDPGEYKGNVTVNSDIWRCDLVGNYSGSNSFQYPDQVVLFNDAEQVGGRFSFLGVAGLVSLFALKASIGI